jgi:MFS family permease
MPAAPGLALLAAASVLLGAAVATTGAMVFSLLATEVPADRRSATLNLVYLPLYIAGVIGPATGSAVAAVGGTSLPFVLGAIVFFAGAAAVAVRRGARRPSPAGPDEPSAAPDEPSVRLAGGPSLSRVLNPAAVRYDPPMRTGVPPSAEPAAAAEAAHDQNGDPAAERRRA